jgi:hypothetical protein
VTQLSGGDAARALAGMRKRESKTCVVCGREFIGIARAKCCSNVCAARAYRQRNREELNARKREKRRQQQGGGE